MSNLTCKTELRHLNQLQRSEIERLLDESDSWRDLISILPKQFEPLDDDRNSTQAERPNDTELLINNEKNLILEKQRLNASPSKALLDYWSTYGIRRPTIEHLIYNASKCRLYRLVDHLVVKVLKQDSIDSFSSKTKSLLIKKCEFEKKSGDEVVQAVDLKSTNNEDLQQGIEGIREIDFELIKKHTNNFNDVKLNDGGNKVGEGGFGVVYLARIPKNELQDRIDCELDYAGKNYLIAVKVVSNDYQDQYRAELKNLADYQHSNLLNLIGLSRHLNTWCILSEYMINNSLQDCLLETNIKPIDHEKRIKIIGQIVDAICYLHTSKEVPLIHRDVKSSNIFLDRNFNSKLCDFGLARSGSLMSKTMHTLNIIGTSVYMAPEVFRGHISVKTDTFSFGIVLLEILTGLPPIDGQNEEFADILSFMIENVFGELEDDEDDCDQNEYKKKIIDHLDKKAGDWNEKIAVQLVDLARKSTNHSKIRRPTMIKVREIFEEIIKNSS